MLVVLSTVLFCSLLLLLLDFVGRQQDRFLPLSTVGHAMVVVDIIASICGVAWRDATDSLPTSHHITHPPNARLLAAFASRLLHGMNGIIWHGTTRAVR